MKMLKKVAAILLVAAMALTMLTACGGGSSTAKTDAQKMEETYMAIFKEVLGKEFENNAALRAQAIEKFNENVADDDSVKMVAGYLKGGAFYIVSAEGKALGLTSEQVNAMYNNPEAIKAIAGEYSNLLKGTHINANEVTAVAAGAITKANGKTYVVVAVAAAKG